MTTSSPEQQPGNDRVGLLRTLRKLAVTLMGVTVILVGVALLVLPGPGIVVIALGLALLGLEYSWARRLSLRMKDSATRLVKRKKNGSSSGT